MAVNLGDKPLADFTQPIEMMTDCHRRIEHFLDVLRRVDRLFGEGELSDEGRRALQARSITLPKLRRSTQTSKSHESPAA